MSGQSLTPIGVGRVVVAQSVLRLLDRCLVCSTRHVAGWYAHTTRPQVRAHEALAYLRERDLIESHQPGRTQPAVHRHSRSLRRKYHIPLVRFDSGKLAHRLALTDVYCALGYPEDFVVEPRFAYHWRGEDRVLCPDIAIGRTLIEVQRTPIPTLRWQQKRMQYEVFFASGASSEYFATPPQVVILQQHDQQTQTIGPGLGYDLHVTRDIQEVRLWVL